MGTKGNASLGKDDAKLAKERFKVLADFVKEQREICLRDRYKLPIPQAPLEVSESLTGVSDTDRSARLARNVRRQMLVKVTVNRHASHVGIRVSR